MGVLEVRDAVTQIGEAVRLLKVIPDPFKQGNFAQVHEEMMQEFGKRNPYITYLVKVRQDLALTLDHLEKQRDNVLRTKTMYIQYYKAMRIHNHIEKKETDIVKFVESFNGIQMLDEKAGLVNQFLSKSMEVFSSDPFWKRASAEEKQEANTMMEKDFMCRIYQK